MRSLFISAMFFCTLIIGMSCKKHTDQKSECTSMPRIFRFSLFTNRDYSNRGEVITFALVIRKSNTILWDTLLPPMKIQDIPASDRKLMIEKTLPANDIPLLEAGFVYSIENVGVSWHWETTELCQNFKAVAFAF